MNAIAAPIASPKNDRRVPFQKPKNKILAAVMKKLGTNPITAIRMLLQMLMASASWGYSAKSCNKLCCKMVLLIGERY